MKGEAVVVLIQFQVGSKQKRIAHLMVVDVLVQIATLREGQPAVQHIPVEAFIGSFVRVNTQVVIKIVPFFKVHLAMTIVAFENFQKPIGLRVLEPEDSESTGRWYMVLRLFLANFYLRQVLNVSGVYDLYDFAFLWN